MRLAIPILGISGIEAVSQIPTDGSDILSIGKLILQLGIGLVSLITFNRRTKNETQKTNKIEELQKELDEIKNQS